MLLLLLLQGDGSGKAKGELRSEIAEAVRRERVKDADGGREYPEHVYESIEV